MARTCCHNFALARTNTRLKKHWCEDDNSPFTNSTGLLAPWKHKFLRTRRAFSCSCLFWAILSSNNTSTTPGVLTTTCWPSVKNVTLTSTLSQQSVTPRVMDLCLGWAPLLIGFSEANGWKKFVCRDRGKSIQPYKRFDLNTSGKQEYHSKSYTSKIPCKGLGPQCVFIRTLDFSASIIFSTYNSQRA